MLRYTCIVRLFALFVTAVILSCLGNRRVRGFFLWYGACQGPEGKRFKVSVKELDQLSQYIYFWTEDFGFDFRKRQEFSLCYYIYANTLYVLYQVVSQQHVLCIKIDASSSLTAHPHL